MDTNSGPAVCVPLTAKSRGIQRGRPAPFGARLCLQSLVCYTFCDRWRGKGAVDGRPQTVFRDSRTGRNCMNRPCDFSLFGCRRRCEMAAVKAATKQRRRDRKRYTKAPVCRSTQFEDQPCKRRCWTSRRETVIMFLKFFKKLFAFQEQFGPSHAHSLWRGHSRSRRR